MNRLWRRADDLVTGLATMIRPGRCICAIAAAAAVGSVAAFDASASQLFKRFGDGTHAVGRDVAPGTYRTSGRNGCYWARLRSFNGSLSAIIANDNAVGPAVVTIARKDKGFETRGCGTWTSNLARITKSKTRFGQGTFIIGTDIAPGTYRARGTGCYWARLRSFGGDLNAVIANDNPTGSTIVTINRSDRGFKSERCGTWTRV